MKFHRAVVPLVLVAAAALTACGGDDDDSFPNATDDAVSGSASPSSTTSAASDGGDVVACDLLTTDEVEAAVGAPVQEGVLSYGPAITGGSFSTCLWQSDDPDNPGSTATLTIYPNAAAADSAREDDSKDIEGIGDSAFSGSFASVWAYVGDRSLFAQWYTFSGAGEDNLPASKALAKAAADKL